MADAIKKFESFYNNFSMEDPTQFNSVYSPNIEFTDPFHHIKGREKLHSYFENMMKRVNHCSFEIKDILVNGQSAVFVWDMKLEHPAINKGAVVILPGTSHLKFDDQYVTYHRDYFDSSQLVYKHVPVLGSVIRLIEGRMA